MSNTASVTTLSTLRQRNLIDRAVELKTLIEGAKGHGSRTLAPFGYYFISTPGCIRPKHNLYGKPTAEVLKAARCNCTNGSIGSFRVIPWQDKALVLAVDSHMIGQPWLAFVPLDQVPDTSTIPERKAA